MTDTRIDEVDPELRDDMRRYLRLTRMVRDLSRDCQLVSAGLIGASALALLISGELWILVTGGLVVLPLIVRTGGRTSRLHGDLVYLHRKWMRRGIVLATDGQSADAVHLQT